MGVVSILAMTCVLSGRALAQEVPGSLEPTRPAEEMTPRDMPRSTPVSQLPLVQEEVVPDEAAQVEFVLKDIVLEGNIVLSKADLQDLWAPYINQTITVAELFEIVNGITRRYADAGYALCVALLPEQKIEEGTVTVRVVEGFVDNIVFAGAVGESFSDFAERNRAEMMAHMAEGIKASKPLMVADLERYLLLMNDIPGIQAQSVFSASPDTPGASTLTINVARKPIEGQLSVNNHMPQSLGRNRMGGSSQLNGQLTGHDSLRVDVWHSLRNSTYEYAAIEFSDMMTSEGFTLGAHAVYASTSPDDGLLSSLDYSGRQALLTISADYPIIRSRQENLSVGAGFEYSNARSKVLGEALTRDKTRAIDLHAVYDFAEASGAVNLLRLSVQQGLDVLNATNDNDSLKSRSNGSAEFTSAKLYALRSQPISGPFSLFLQGQAQAALNDPLLSGSECSFGGRTFGRGYDSGAFSGDHCVQGSAELRLTKSLSPNFALQLYSFVDSGIAWQKGSLQAGEDRKVDATSVGGGFRLNFFDFTEGNVEIALPLQDQYAEEERRDARIFLSLSSKF